jgi:hypothetical protein
LDKVVDADVTNFTDLVTEVVNTYPHEYGHKVSLFYFCIERQLNIQVRNDQDLVDMFAKHKASKRCFLTFAYHSPTTEPPEIAAWDFSSSWESIEIPVTPSMPCPTIAPPSQSQSQSQTADDDEYLANPNPSNEHVGVDDEGLYLDLGPQQPPPPRKTLFQSSSKQRDVEGSDADTYCETESDDESDSDVDYDIEDVDEIIKDSEPDRMPDAEYDKKDPPMTVGTVYRDMNAFKLALASHAIKREFLYDIEKSDTGRYRVYCCGSIEGCKWRLHASVMKDGQSVKVQSLLHILYAF